MQPTIAIKSAVDALNLLEHPERIDFDTITFDEFESFSFKLRGKNYDGTITPPIMRGFDDLQKSIYRAFAIIKTSDANINSLTDDEKKSLEIAVKVSEGSSEYFIKNAYAIMETFKGAIRKMSGRQALIAIAILAVVAALFIGKEGAAIWAQQQIDEKKIEEARFAEEQQTQRLSDVLKLASQSTELSKLLVEADRSKRSLLANALDADSLEIDGKALSKETANKILEESEPAVNQTRLDGTYKVLQMNTGNDEHFGVRLFEVNSGKTFSAKIDNLVLKQYQEIIQKAVFDREPVALKINATLKGDAVTSAFVVSAKSISTPEKK